MNVVVLRGRLSRPALERTLASEDRLVSLEVTVPRPGRADTVPVVARNAPPAVALLETDEEVVVVGRVRRRFFRSGSGTASRTEVVASQIVPPPGSPNGLPRRWTAAVATLEEGR